MPEPKFFVDLGLEEALFLLFWLKSLSSHTGMIVLGCWSESDCAIAERVIDRVNDSMLIDQAFQHEENCAHLEKCLERPFVEPPPT